LVRFRWESIGWESSRDISAPWLRAPSYQTRKGMSRNSRSPEWVAGAILVIAIFRCGGEY
jgi:hypothetical protein